jgi:hypothetical protein
MSAAFGPAASAGVTGAIRQAAAGTESEYLLPKLLSNAIARDGTSPDEERFGTSKS